MTLPLTLQPDCPQESVAANESPSTQILGVMYITLTGLIDSMVPTSRPWALLVKLLSYIVKLAPILWWALPAGPVGHLPTSSQEPPMGWIPDSPPPVLRELEDHIHGSFPMLQEALAELTHAKGASEWAVTAYKDAQLVCLDLVSLSGVYCINSIGLVWDVLATLSFKNIPEMGRAHAAACFCFPVEHILSYLLENFWRVVGELAVADATAAKKTKILLADFGLAWSANKTGVPPAMELMFAKTKHKKKISAVFNKVCKFTKAFAGQRLHLVVYLGYSFYFRMSASVENLDRVLL
ncbi:hypothetical protein DSO57_1035517 [Entomophthora muscae]|uniref:Uncharacterized protein n=1 Tax=Entomophthora muscae TaxID=34485 RepID=A0ACC2SNF9_9FUNG|nr:hypothetical protein DSO57_1035517 [Entomophthora muscae]